jgi:hypothetical protein
MLVPGLEFLKSNKLVGRKLADLIYGELQGDAAAFQIWLIRKISKNNQLALIAGRTFK